MKDDQAYPHTSLARWFPTQRPLHRFQSIIEPETFFNGTVRADHFNNM